MMKRKPELRPQILEEAVAWLIDLGEEPGDVSANAEFNVWLRRSPEHVHAFLEVSAVWEDVELLGRRPGLDLERVIERAREHVNVISLESAANVDANPPRRIFRRSRVPATVAASVLIGIAAGVTAWQLFYRVPVYATEIGEQRSISLQDGTKVELNSRSRIKLRYTERQRAVELIEGQALFKVAKDTARPFIVTAGETQVRAVGTEFDVYRKRSGTVVTVVEGRVAVAAHRSVLPVLTAILRNGSETNARAASTKGSKVLNAANGELLLTAGEQSSIHQATIAPPRPADIRVATAWTEQRLVFRDTPLQEVVDEFNRYNRQQLVIRDLQLQEFHISGVFPTTDVTRLVEFLRQRFGVTLRRSEQTIEIHAASNG